MREPGPDELKCLVSERSCPSFEWRLSVRLRLALMPC